MMRVVLIGLLALTAACSTNRPEEGGFYSWVDAQGNLVSMPRERAAEPGPVAAEPEPAAAETETPPDSQEDGFLSAEEAVQLMEERERDRFVVYQDASGYRIVQPVDVVEARRARERELAARSQPLEERERPYIERVEGVPADCCADLLGKAVALKPGVELLFGFERGPWQWIRLPELRPAVAVKLAPEVASVRFQTFLLPKGYLHPQALFLNASGEPVLLVDNLFVRRFPETWYRHGWLEGELPVVPDAVWLVMYLGYAAPSATGRPEGVPGEYYWREPSSPLAVQGELVLRGFAGVRAP
jgi:hypothetical protein